MKNAMFTYCKPEPSAYFTFHQCNSSISGSLQESRPEKRRAENYKNGRERPHFFGFNPPKKFSRSLPPVSQIRHSTPPDRNRKGLERIARLTDSPHTDLNDFRIKACMAGPQEGEASQCPY